jgi:hypothetical protein
MAGMTETEMEPPERLTRAWPVDRLDVMLVVGVMLLSLGMAWLIHPAMALVILGVSLMAYALRVG